VISDVKELHEVAAVKARDDKISLLAGFGDIITQIGKIFLVRNGLDARGTPRAW
jgi:hypothetical protein